MTCNEYSEDIIFSYAAGELGDAEAQALKAHIEGCGECRKTYEECRALLSDIKESGDEVPDELLAGVMAKVREEKKPKHLTLRKIAVTAACAAVLVGAGALALSTRNENKKPVLPKEPIEMGAKSDEKSESSIDFDTNTELYSKTEVKEESVEQAIESELTDDAEVAYDKKDGAFIPYCPVHSEAYHTIPTALIAYVGEDAYEEWISSLEVTDGECPAVKLLDFIVNFDIPNDILLECYENEGLEGQWNIEALCLRDAEAWEEYCKK